MNENTKKIHEALKSHIEAIERLQDVCRTEAPYLNDYLEMSKASLYDADSELFETETNGWRLS